MRALRAPLVLLRASILGSLQYRIDFALDVVYAFFQLAWLLVPMLVVFGQRARIAGWTLDEALLVTAWFTGLKSLREGLITPSLVGTIEQIRRGTFDFVLVKPVDAQLIASSSKLDVFCVVDLLASVAIGTYALVHLHYVPSLARGAVTALLTLSAVAILYSLNVMAASVAFYVARIDNLAYLLGSLFDAARWPSTVFRGAMRVFFTFVLPLGVMTTYPPLALLGRLDMRGALTAIGLGIAGLVLSRIVWLRALSAYRSAGG